MPKSYSENERTYIKRRLMEEARLCLDRFGLRKTTVDELVKRVNIPKGTFYLFYESKELLFFDVLSEFQNEVQAKLFREISSQKDGINPSTLTRLLWELYKAVEKSFLLKFVTNGELELLIRKLPPRVAQEHAAVDDLHVEHLLSLVPNMKKDKLQVFSAALRGIFLSMLHKHEIGAEVFDDALKMMIHGVVLQMFEEESI